MPSGHSGGGSFSGGHFGGATVSGSRGGHFGGSRSSGMSSGVHRPWYSPRVMVFGGRTVYLGSGRASAFSALGVLVVFAMIATFIAGMIWLDANDSLKEIKNNYTFYHAMAEYAAEHAEYQTIGTVTKSKRYAGGDKYCIYYSFKTASGATVDDGVSFYVYDFATASKIKSDGTVVLALDTTNDKTIKTTDSVPLDYKDSVLEDDNEYVHYNATRNISRVATFVLIGISVALIVSAVLVPLTAKKATAEQIAESKNGGTSSNNSDAQSAPAGTWRCAYCGALNDNSKERCDGCGAKRQK